ncbi:MAG: insulinase family protein [Phycisphaerales bacterium]|nr:MAG: insulinase family protein [Phycisphaerales bacterium]
MSDPYTLHTLDNGLRIVIEQMGDVRSAAVGFLVRTGARDEDPEIAGVSHFLEHMMFKGTEKRHWREVTIDFDRMGSIYNAYTSEERTVYFGWVRHKDIGKQMELLADMIRSTLPADEFEMEKKVVLEEIAMANDELEHLAFDFILEKVFEGSSLAWPVLGYERTLTPLTRDRMHEYFRQRYAPDNMVLVAAGNVDPSEIIGMTEELCGSWEASGTATQRSVSEARTGVDVLHADRFQQQFLCLSFSSVSAADNLAETASAAATILGGSNSRFFWNIVQAGLSPRAGVHHLDYTNTGLMLLYGACQPENAEKLVDAMREEAKRICTERVQEHEVDRVKNRRRTSLAVESEAPYHRLVQLMDDMEYRGSPRTVEQMLAEVDAVSVDTIHEYFQRYPINGAGHLASAGPRRWPEKD